MQTSPRQTGLLFFLQLAVLVGLCAIMTVSASVPLRNALEIVSSNTIINLSLYSFVSYAVYALCCLPIRYTQRFGNILRNGLAPEAAVWAKKYARQEGGKAVWFMLGLQVVYFFLQISTLWWIWLALTTAVIIGLWEISFFWLVPLLLNMPVLADRQLCQRLSAIPQRLGIEVRGIYQSSLPIAGLLRSGAILVRGLKKDRVVVNTAVSDYSPAEVEVLLARNVAQHHYNIHLKRAAARLLSVVMLCAAVGVSFEPLARGMRFSPITDIATAPLMVFLFAAYGVPLRLFINLYLRAAEKDVDRFALQVTRAPDALVSLLIREAASQPSDDVPRSRFMQLWHSPGLPREQRLAEAQNFADEMFARRRMR